MPDELSQKTSLWKYSQLGGRCSAVWLSSARLLLLSRGPTPKASRLGSASPRPLCPAEAPSNQPAGQPAPLGTPYQILAQQLIVKDFHLTLFCQLLAQTDGLFPHLQGRSWRQRLEGLQACRAVAEEGTGAAPHLGLSHKPPCSPDPAPCPGNQMHPKKQAYPLLLTPVS